MTEFKKKIFTGNSANNSGSGTSDLKGINYSYGASEIIMLFFLDSSVIPHGIHHSLMGRAEG